MQTKRSLIAFFSLAALVFLVPFFEGGRDIFAFIISSFLLLPMVYFSYDREEQLNLKNKYVGLFLLFIVWSVVNSYLQTKNVYMTTQALLWWWIYFVVFCMALRILDRINLKRISYVLISLGVLLGFIGLSDFLNNTTGYLRLDSLFYQHNAFGGFLIMPFMLACGYFFTTQKRKEKMWLSAGAAFLLALIVLTFSRGTLLSLVISLVVGAICTLSSPVGRQKIGSHWKTLSKAVVLVGVTAAVFSLVIFSWAAHRSHQNIASQGAALYQGEDEGENAVTLRLHYFADALQVIKAHPVFGVGVEAYPNANQQIRKTVAFYASDPHELYLKLFAEEGIGSLFLFAFFGLILFLGLKAFKKHDDPVTIAITLGLFALLVHNGMEVDWRYPANTLLFFVFAAALIRSTEPSLTIPWTRKNGEQLLLALSLIFLVPVASIFLTENHLLDAQFYLTKFDNVSARDELAKANKVNFIHNPEVYFTLSKTAFADGKVPLAKEYLTTALHYAPTNAEYYSAQATVARSLKDPVLYEAALKKTIALNMTASSAEIEALGAFYVQMKRNAEAVTLLEYYVPKFGDYIQTNVYKNDPQASLIKKNLIIMMVDLGNAYAALGNSAKSDEVKLMILKYAKLQ